MHAADVNMSLPARPKPAVHIPLHMCHVAFFSMLTLFCSPIQTQLTILYILQVTLTGGAEHPAKVVGFDEDRDVAVLQLVTEEGDLVRSTPLMFA